MYDALMRETLLLSRNSLVWPVLSNIFRGVSPFVQGESNRRGLLIVAHMITMCVT